MKSFLMLLIISICVIGWRSGDIIQMIGIGKSVANAGSTANGKATLIEVPVSATPSASKAKTTMVEVPVSTASNGKDNKPAHRAMTAQGFTALSNTDPDAYRKYVHSHEVREPTEADKLMNFLARGKYE